MGGPDLVPDKGCCPPDLAGSDPFARLAEAHEIAITMAWIRDNTAFSKARLERLGQGGKGEETEAGPSKPDGKKLKEQKKEAKAKAAAAKAGSEKK